MDEKGTVLEAGATALVTCSEVSETGGPWS
jgi:hypothetical protein